MREHIKAKKWRERIVTPLRKKSGIPPGLSVSELSEMTGYSSESIYLFEKGFTYDARGVTRGGDLRIKPINKKAWKRYRMACAGVSASLSGSTFNW